MKQIELDIGLTSEPPQELIDCIVGGKPIELVLKFGNLHAALTDRVRLEKLADAAMDVVNCHTVGRDAMMDNFVAKLEYLIGG